MRDIINPLKYNTMNGNLEIRKVPPGAIYGLVQILECGNNWKKLMSIIPKQENENGSVPKYTYDHVQIIQIAGGTQKRPCAEIFLEEWGTSGKKRPTLNILLQLLIKAELFRAAEFVKVDLLKESAPERPATGPAADVDVSEDTIQQILSSKLSRPIFSNKNDLLNLSENKRVSEPGTKDLAMSNPQMLRNEIAGNVCTARNETMQEVGGPCNQMLLFMEESTNVPVGSDVKHIPYSYLQHYTNNFCENPFLLSNIAHGRKLGSGAFGSVYLGILPSSIKIAVKRLREDGINIEKQFKNEMYTLSRYHHTNLLPLLGYSCDSPYPCLVYAYMSNGSLQDRLACKDETPLLPWQKRIHIAFGAAQGIQYLHTAYEKPLVHRDIKSANILLDENMTAKLGDFGLVRMAASGEHEHTATLTTAIFGTSAYMAPEAFHGDISVKLDSFSFGVVLLELLTSLPPYDEKREVHDLVHHIEDTCEASIQPLLDERAGNWTINCIADAADVLYYIATDCLKEKKHRPCMDSVVDSFKKLINALRNPSQI